MINWMVFRDFGEFLDGPQGFWDGFSFFLANWVRTLKTRVCMEHACLSFYLFPIVLFPATTISSRFSRVDSSD